MNLLQGIKMAWKSISTNKMRSFLTMLGIIIGVAAVIALVAVGQGTTAKVTEQVASLGTNLLTVNITGRGAATALTFEEAQAYADIPGVQGVSPIINGRISAKYGNVVKSVPLEGITPDYELVRGFHVQSGRFITGLDIDYRQRVALIGTTTAQNLKLDDPVGQTIRINGQSYTIVGLLMPKGNSLGGSNDDKILIPITSAERLLRVKGIRSIYIQAETPEMVAPVKEALEADLQGKFKGSTTAYTVFDQQEMLSTMSSIANTMALALGGIAGISLLVGGIGIMNIMLVSVSERTREIGIRKAIGAKKRDILLQFLIESMVLGGLGGLVGIMIGVGGASLAGRLTDMSVSISWSVAVFAFVFSLGIGVFFGMFPANKAAKLRPIEALRTD
jgi:putative ABC transport system permease protein